MSAVFGLVVLPKRGELAAPVPFVELPEGAGRDRVLTVDKLARLHEAAVPHLRDFILLSIGTCARPGAVLELTRFQGDLAAGLIDLNPPGRRQTKKRRPVVPLLSALRPIIAKSEGHLVTFRKRPMASVRRSWNEARERAGLDEDVVPYTLRHTAATEMSARGVPDGQVAVYLGHDMAGHHTTARYVRRRPEYLAEGAAALEAVIKEMGHRGANSVAHGWKPVQRSGCVQVPKSEGVLTPCSVGAGDEIRTHDPNLGKVVLYP